MGSEPPCVDVCSHSHLLSFTSESFYVNWRISDVQIHRLSNLSILFNRILNPLHSRHVKNQTGLLFQVELMSGLSLRTNSLNFLDILFVTFVADISILISNLCNKF
jgi:hypothetical protein